MQKASDDWAFRCDHPANLSSGMMSVNGYFMSLHLAFRQTLEKIKFVCNLRSQNWHRQHLEVTIQLLSKWNTHLMLFVIITTGTKWIFLAQISQFEGCPSKDNGSVGLFKQSTKSGLNLQGNSLTQVRSLSIIPLWQTARKWAGPWKAIFVFVYFCCTYRT